MKFLVDNQLPKALAEHLRAQGQDCQHVLEAGLGDASDISICRYAKAQDRVLISKAEEAQRGDARSTLRLGRAEARPYKRIQDREGRAQHAVPLQRDWAVALRYE